MPTSPKLIYSHDRSLCKKPRYTKEPSITNRLFSNLTKMTLSSAFSQTFMTGDLRKEASMADWHSQSAPSTGSGAMKCKSIGSLVATFSGSNNLRHPYNFIVYSGSSFLCNIQTANDISTRYYFFIYTCGYPRIKDMQCNRQV